MTSLSNDMELRIAEMQNLAWASEPSIVEGGLEMAFMAPSAQEALIAKAEQAIEEQDWDDAKVAAALSISEAQVKWLVARFCLANGTSRAPKTALYPRREATGKRADQS